MGRGGKSPTEWVGEKLGRMKRVCQTSYTPLSQPFAIKRNREMGAVAEEQYGVKGGFLFLKMRDFMLERTSQSRGENQ